MKQGDELSQRTKQFAVRVVGMYESLPKTDAARVIGRQVLRSGTSVAANYRAAGRARSRAEFVAKLGIVVEEADETVLWLELLVDCGIVPRERMDPLLIEANELLAIFAAAQLTAKSKAPLRTS
jgi:four helix bundle protein